MALISRLVVGRPRGGRSGNAGAGGGLVLQGGALHYRELSDYRELRLRVNGVEREGSGERVEWRRLEVECSRW